MGWAWGLRTTAGIARVPCLLLDRLSIGCHNQPLLIYMHDLQDLCVGDYAAYSQSRHYLFKSLRVLPRIFDTDEAIRDSEFVRVRVPMQLLKILWDRTGATALRLRLITMLGRQLTRGARKEPSANIGRYGVDCCRHPPEALFVSGHVRMDWLFILSQATRNTTANQLQCRLAADKLHTMFL